MQKLHCTRYSLSPWADCKHHLPAIITTCQAAAARFIAEVVQTTPFCSNSTSNVPVCPKAAMIRYLHLQNNVSPSHCKEAGSIVSMPIHVACQQVTGVDTSQLHNHEMLSCSERHSRLFSWPLFRYWQALHCTMTMVVLCNSSAARLISAPC